ncbi:response regulator [Candidatus Albibeggiatoa sp. nov. BB20]|uniref:response regulator n=1 Tax=Candidatus Albibeggiatoa sp. nov. BB20 TaxID=3162723 RepID=UPI003365546A
MDKVFKVGIFGLASNEQNTLGSIFKLAASRSRQYELVPADQRSAAEIILVDADDANAMNEWRSFTVHHNNIPVVKVTKGAIDDSGSDIHLRRPLTLKRVLEVLDKVTIEAHKYVPELVVGGEEVLDDAASAALQDAVQSAKDASKSNARALVVDDSLPVRKSMEIQLGLYGLNIDFAETGEEALDYVKKPDNVYDIIFLDLMLPGIDGYKVCKEIKSNKVSKNTPVVMLTGKGSRFDKLRGTMAGASVYLTKPVEQEKLKEVIKQFLPDATAVNA